MPCPHSSAPSAPALALGLGCPGKGPLLSATSLHASSGPPTRQLPGPPPEASGARGEPAESTPCAPCSGASLWVIRLSFIHSFIRRLVADRAGLNSWLPKDSLCPQANDFHSPGRPQFPSLQNGISTSPAWTQPSVGSVLRTVVSAPPWAHPKITFPSPVCRRDADCLGPEHCEARRCLRLP